ncbi:LysR substrate-binding domain-containing protein [Halomonas janggokensis]|uniref:LysR substrate-binding domain-containing protein n=1 Tax=Vreelandella janggokensis TaxID=370767 RepID=A0ABT4ITQ4_9GAMM|nr:LysR substrate-binding domain-containing protein [Halomonas janggokensis]MCZ0927018.1 LysR substrate-binding domain-containing protein [Halomonas janggokensis]MCZ0929556.1 LysR substrate-binding domain-containing protein [Halomonas janggokensis]
MATLPTIDHELLRTFVAIVDQGGFTRAAAAVNRTQSAVSMQIKRLEEDVIQRPLFVRQNRQLVLTSEGNTLLGYARKILSLQGEALTLLRQPDMVGRVRLGVPDDYVMRFLPGILRTFSQAWPLVDVDVHCAPSSVLSQQPQGSLDLIIMTREIGDEIGTILRREPTVWVAAESHSTHLQTPVPLALFEAPCFCRRHACNALDRAGRAYRLAYSSPSLATLQAVVGAGLAVSAWMRSLVTAEMQILGKEEGFPELPEASIVLLHTSSTQSPIIDSLAEHIGEGFRL